MYGTRALLAPVVNIDHDRERYMVIVDLAGVDKNDIDVEITETSLCVHASREDAVLTGCYFLAHPVNVDEAMAAFDGRSLNVMLPFRSPIRGRRVEVREGRLDFGLDNPRRIEVETGRGSLGIGTQ